MSAAQGAAALAALYSITSTVAAAAVPPTSIATDSTVAAYYGAAPPQQFNPQFLIAATGVEGVKQTPRYIGSGRVEEFELNGVVWGSIADGATDNLEALSTFLLSLVDSISAAIDTDPSMGGVALMSWLSGYDLAFDVAKTGRTVQVDFQVHVETQVS